MEDDRMAKDEEMEDTRKEELEFIVCLSKVNVIARKVDGYTAGIMRETLERRDNLEEMTKVLCLSVFLSSKLTWSVAR
jgi:hypothetical protein